MANYLSNKINYLINILILTCLLWDFNESKRSKNVFKISVYYDDTYDNVEELVSYTVDSINRLLKSNHFQFEYTINKVDKNGSYKLVKTLCNEIKDGHIAVIAIGDSQVFFNLYAITNSLRIPYLSIKWDSLEDSNSIVSFSTKLASLNDKSENDLNEVIILNDVNNDNRRNLVESLRKQTPTSPITNEVTQINLYPPAHKLMKAILDLITFYNWDYVTILFQEFDSLYRIEDLIRLQKKSKNEKLRFTVKQLGSDVKKWIYLLKEIKLSGSSHIIVDVQARYLNKFFEMAEEVDMTTSYFHFMLTSLDLSALDHLPSSNITAFQVFEPNNTNVQALLAEFNLKNMASYKPLYKYISSEALFIYDAFLILANAIDQNNLIELIAQSVPGSCDNENKWSLGSEFMNFLKMTNINSVTGHIEFDEKTGYRKNISLTLVDKTKVGVDLIGYWRESSKNESVEIVRSYAKTKDQVINRLKRHLVVSTKLEAPYAMRRDLNGNITLIGNAQYKGFCIDLLERIAKMCGFNYTIKLVDDGFHGSFVDGKWNGLVSELIDKKADLVVAALTISNVREQVIDFTTPFLNLGISILMKRPSKPVPPLFSFLSPLSVEVWLYMLASYIIVSVMLFVLARFSPYEWTNHHPCNQGSLLVSNQWSLHNSFWFTMVNLLRQGTNISASVSPSVRIICIFWAFFTLLLISSYTANLAAFLTVQRMKSSIESVEDLSKQTDIKYGSVKSGSTENFFKESKIPTYERMWKFMSANPSVFVRSADEGIARVRNGSYAYLMESTSNEYIRQRDCELMQIGGLLDTKGYGIGTPAGSPWRDIISNAILQLQENGDLQELYTKWWMVEDIDASKKCENTYDDKKDSASELSIESVGGVFVVMVVGIILSIFVAVCEFMCKVGVTKSKNIKFSNHAKIGFGRTLKQFLKAEFETPFPKLEHQKRKYDSQIKQIKMQYTLNNDETGQLLKLNVNAAKVLRENNSINCDEQTKSIEIYAEEKNKKRFNFEEEKEKEKERDFSPQSSVKKRILLRSLSSDNPRQVNIEDLNVKKTPKKYYYLTPVEPVIEFDYVKNKRVALV